MSKSTESETLEGATKIIHTLVEHLKQEPDCEHCFSLFDEVFE